jgi:hypothetical protein
MNNQTHLHLLRRHYRLLLRNAELILSNPVMYGSPLQLYFAPYSSTHTDLFFEGDSREKERLPHSKCMRLTTLLRIWQQAPRFRGETVLYLENEKVLRSTHLTEAPFERLVTRRWIAAENGALREASVPESTTGGLFRKMAMIQGKTWPGAPSGQPERKPLETATLPPEVKLSSYDFPEEPEVPLFLPFHRVIKALEQTDDAISDELAFIFRSGETAIRQSLQQQGIAAHDYRFRFFTDPEDEEQLICRIILPSRDVRQAPGSNLPLVNKSIAAKRPIMRQVANEVERMNSYRFGEEDYVYLYERRFSFDDVFDILSEDHMQEISRVVRQCERAFVNR